MTQQNITIEQARAKLGSRAEKMKDADIQAIINSLYFLCEQVVEDLINKPREKQQA